MPQSIVFLDDNESEKLRQISEMVGRSKSETIRLLVREADAKRVEKLATKEKVEKEK